MDAEKWERIYEHIKARQFELGARLPISWTSVSLGLKHAADRLYDLQHDATLRRIKRAIEEHGKVRDADRSRKLEGEELEDFLDSQMISVYYLLMGYAIENLLKAILMIQHPEYFKPDAKLADIGSHILVGLCKQCGISVQHEEVELLNKLTTYVVWQGRYPIPLQPDRMWPTRRDDGTWKTRGEAFRGRQPQEKIDNLYTKIWNELECRRKASLTQ